MLRWLYGRDEGMLRDSGTLTMEASATQVCQGRGKRKCYWNLPIAVALENALS